jgi:hypothetical protein
MCVIGLAGTHRYHVLLVCRRLWGCGELERHGLVLMGSLLPESLEIDACRLPKVPENRGEKSKKRSRGVDVPVAVSARRNQSLAKLPTRLFDV